MLAHELLSTVIDTPYSKNPICAIDLLNAIREAPLSAANLTIECSVARSTVYDTLNPFVDTGLVERTEDGFQLTGAGAMFLRVYTDLSVEERRLLERLPMLKSRRELLDGLAERPATKAELNERYDTMSYSSIQRAVDQFEKRELVEPNRRRRYELSEDGYRAVNCETKLLAAMETILEYELSFQYFAPECDDFPIGAMDEAKLVRGCKDLPRAERNAYVEFIESLDPTTCNQLRLFSAYYDEEMGQLFLEHFLRTGTQIDIVSPRRALNNIPTTARGAKQVQAALEAENFSWKLCSGDVPIGLTLVDREYAIFYPRRPVGGVSDSGMLYAENEEIIEWAHELFETYDATSKPPLESILEVARSIATDCSW